MNIQPGQWVRLRAYGGEEIVRRVVRDTERVVIVCTDQEYKDAERERRDPQAVGFLKEYVIEALATSA